VPVATRFRLLLFGICDPADCLMRAHDSRSRLGCFCSPAETPVSLNPVLCSQFIIWRKEVWILVELVGIELAQCSENTQVVDSR
jgi:hypothetical protein